RRPSSSPSTSPPTSRTCVGRTPSWPAGGGRLCGMPSPASSPMAGSSTPASRAGPTCSTTPEAPLLLLSLQAPEARFPPPPLARRRCRASLPRGRTAPFSDGRPRPGAAPPYLAPAPHFPPRPRSPPSLPALSDPAPPPDPRREPPACSKPPRTPASTAERQRGGRNNGAVPRPLCTHRGLGVPPLRRVTRLSGRAQN